jgi:hypothetical protein
MRHLALAAERLQNAASQLPLAACLSEAVSNVVSDESGLIAYMLMIYIIIAKASQKAWQGCSHWQQSDYKMLPPNNDWQVRPSLVMLVLLGLCRRCY